MHSMILTRAPIVGLPSSIMEASEYLPLSVTCTCPRAKFKNASKSHVGGEGKESVRAASTLDHDTPLTSPTKRPSGRSKSHDPQKRRNVNGQCPSATQLDRAFLLRIEQLYLYRCRSSFIAPQSMPSLSGLNCDALPSRWVRPAIQTTSCQVSGRNIYVVVGSVR